LNISDSPAAAAPFAAPAPTRFPPRWFGALMIVLFALIMPVAYAGNQGEAVIVAVGGGFSLLFVFRLRAPPLGVVLIGALAIWAAISFAWSPLAGRLYTIHRYGDLEALTAPKLLLQAVLDCAFVLGALILPPDQRAKALKLTGILLLAVMGVLMIEAAEGGQIYGFLNSFGKHPLRADLAKRDAARGCYAVVLVFWPLALLTWNKIPVAIPGVVAACLVVSSLMLGVDAPVAALLLSLVVFGGMRVNARLGAWVCMVAVVVYFLAAPLVFLPHGHAAADIPSDMGKESWHIRVSIWRFASALIAHRPLLGYGLDASRAFGDAIPMHPHDAAIQLWLETGVLGALLGALFWGWLFFRIQRVGREDPVWAAMACATAAAYLLISAISFGVWQEWWLGLGAIAIACCAMVLQTRREVRPETLKGGLASLR
jgi:O-antigen ligase